MDLKQLEAFVRVAELGSFTRAAQALDVTQPVLSRQVRQLEIELAQHLLTRNGRGATPTEAGKLLLDHGRGILHQLSVATEVVRGARGRLVGQVSIGLPPSLSRLVAVPLTLALREAMPDAHLTLIEGFSLSMVEGLKLGRLDIAAIYSPDPHPEINAVVLRRETLALISPRAGEQPDPALPRPALPALPFSAVAPLPLILPSRPNVFRVLIDKAYARQGLRPKVELEVDSLNALLSMVRQGLGHAVLPPYTLVHSEFPGDFVLQPIAQPQLTTELQLIHSIQRPLSAAQRLAMQIMQRVIDAELGPEAAVD